MAVSNISLCGYVVWVYFISSSVDIYWGIKEAAVCRHFISGSTACSAGQKLETVDFWMLTAATKWINPNFFKHDGLFFVLERYATEQLSVILMWRSAVVELYYNRYNSWQI